LPPQRGALVAEDSAALDDGRLDELAASLGVTIGDARRMVELAPRRTYRGRLDLEEIRRRYEAGESIAAIGAVGGVSRTAVRDAMIRAGIPTRPGPRPAGERRGPLRHLDVEEIRRRWETGETLVAIARAVGASRGGVRLAMERVGNDRRSRRRALSLSKGSRLDIDEIRRRYQAGETIVGIARAVGASESGVGGAVRRCGIQRGPAG
jgi:hypothetical protein